MIPGGLNLGLMDGSKIIAYDDFSDADGTSILSKALDIGGSWARIRASGSITSCSSGKAITANFTAGEFFITASLSESVQVSATLNPKINSGYTAIILASDGANYNPGVASNFITCQLNYNTSLSIRQWVNGTPTALTTNTNYKPQNTDYECIATVSGTQITFNVVGLGSISATLSATSTNSRHGFGISWPANGTSPTVDNFKVESL